jgi:hypothetical protein
MNPASEKKMYDLSKPLWSIYLALKYNPEYKKAIWSIISDKDKAAIRAAVAGSKSKP